MKKYETVKLFWGTYLHRLTIRNRLSVIFREKNLSYARQVLDKLQHQYEKGEKLFYYQGSRERPIQEEDFLDAKRLYNYFSRCDDYKIRVESISISVYSNDIAWIKKIIAGVDPTSVICLHSPDPKFVENLDSNSILIDADIGYEYKVTLGSKKGSPEFAAWAEKNKKMIRMGPVTTKEMLESGYVNGMYFYARDDRTLQLCSLMTDNIRRIDKLIVKQDIDK